MELSDQVYGISLDEIDISRFNVRRTGRDIDIKDLAESIEKHGLLQPVTLIGSHGNPPYELIVGQRRYLAHEFLGKKTIRAVFYGDVDELQAKVLSLAENLHRLDLNKADQAEAITELYLRFDRDAQRVARELGISTKTVREYVKLEEQATPKAKERLREQKVTKEDVKRVIVAAQGDEEKADRILDEFSNLTRYEKDRAARYGRANPTARADEVLEEAKTPRIESTVVLNLPKEMDHALTEASLQLAMDREAVAFMALSEWLANGGYLASQA